MAEFLLAPDPLFADRRDAGRALAATVERERGHEPMEARLRELERRFEQLLDESALSEELRGAWLAHLRRGRGHRAPPPPTRFKSS